MSHTTPKSEQDLPPFCTCPPSDSIPYLDTECQGFFLSQFEFLSFVTTFLSPQQLDNQPTLRAVFRDSRNVFFGLVTGFFEFGHNFFKFDQKKFFEFGHNCLVTKSFQSHKILVTKFFLSQNFLSHKKVLVTKIFQ